MYIYTFKQIIVFIIFGAHCLWFEVKLGKNEGLLYKNWDK